MNNEVVSQYNEYLKMTGGDRAAAASLTLAAVMMEGRHTEVSAPPATALTVAEVAVRLRITPKTVYQLCQSRRLHCYRAGRSLRIPLEDVERFEHDSGARDRPPRFPEIFRRHC